MTLRTSHFPRRNAVLIAAGATCFFVGDYLVGFNLSLEPSLQRATTVFLTWVFYTPAITLFALSGYRWGGDRPAGRVPTNRVSTVDRTPLHAGVVPPVVGLPPDFGLWWPVGGDPDWPTVYGAVRVRAWSGKSQESVL